VSYASRSQSRATRSTSSGCRVRRQRGPSISKAIRPPTWWSASSSRSRRRSRAMSSTARFRSAARQCWPRQCLDRRHWMAAGIDAVEASSPVWRCRAVAS
jgi:hypothetical protein